eukprot:scaffold1250_cov184-Amphora_coffeaeformis.AAC.2
MFPSMIADSVGRQDSFPRTNREYANGMGNGKPTFFTHRLYTPAAGSTKGRNTVVARNVSCERSPELMLVWYGTAHVSIQSCRGGPA